MLTKKIVCPSCSVNLRIAETLPAGKRVKCPKCGSGFPVPVGNGERLPEAATAKKKRKSPRPKEEQDWDEQVEKRPIYQTRRKKRKKKAGSNALVLSLVIIGVVFVIGAGVTLVIVRRASAARNSATVANNPTPAVPGASRLPAGKSFTVADNNSSTVMPVDSRTGTASEAASPSSGDSDRFATGRSVFQENCTRCHNIGDAGGRKGRGPDLTRVGADPTHTVSWLMDHIHDPKSHRPESRMPRFAGRINDDDLRALATYLASLT
jgi:mono/diheme cytochrome c family protein/Zn-finger nucleic acid-binding protein